MAEERESESVGTTVLIAVLGAAAVGGSTYIATKNKGSAFGAGLGNSIAILKGGDAMDLITYSVLGGILGKLILTKIGGDAAFLGSACSECSKHPNNGLNFPISHLEKIVNDIPFYPIAKQALYADAVCKEYVNDPVKLNLFKPVGSPRSWNTTSVGNLAYIALNSNNQLAREYSRGLLDLFKKYKNGKL